MSFKVKALYDYSSEHDDDLNFAEGQIMTITDDDDADWYTGEYTDEATGEHRSGLFPRNFVERYEPVTPPRPARRPQAAAPVPVPPPPAEHEHEEEDERLPAPAVEPSAEVRPAEPKAAPQEEPAEDEEEEDGEDEAASEPPPPVMATKPPPPPSAAQDAQRVEKAPKPSGQASSATQGASKSPPAQPQPQSKPEVAEKPVTSSFRDRIAAFNKGGAAPVAPPKPGGLSGGSGSSGFIKKSYMAPPPSRNAYVPPTTSAPVAKIYRREEDPEMKSQDENSAPAPAPVQMPSGEGADEPDEDQPKPMSLKERMALLQKQQLEQQSRHAEAAQKKAKPKPPPKKSSSSSQPPVPETLPEDGEPGPPPKRVLSNESTMAEPVASPEPEVPLQPVHHEDDEPMERSTHSLGASQHEAITSDAVEDGEVEEGDEKGGEEDEEEGEEEEDEIDPEVRRRMEIRERMAKMSGGMGMGAMFGSPGGLPGMGARKPSKPKQVEPSADSGEAELSNSPPAQAVPVMPGMGMPGMALPGMGMPRPKKADPQEDELQVSKEDESEEEEEPISQTRAPNDVHDIEDVKQQPTDTAARQVEPERELPPPPPRTETRPAPPVPTSPREPSKRQSMASVDSTPIDRAAPPVPQRAPEPPETRGAPPPPPQVSSPPQPPSSPPARSSMSEKRTSRLPPPVPGSAIAETSSYSRGPPPPPPAVPPRQSMDESRPQESDEEEEDDDESDAAEKFESKNRDDDALHHAGLPSLGPASQTRAPPPPPPGQQPAQAPRGVPPPPPPSQPPRQSKELPRAPPPIPPPAASPPVDDDYDPFNYQSNPQGVPTKSSTTSPRIEVQQNDLYEASPPQSPAARGPPPLPPTQAPSQAAPALPPPAQPPTQAAPPPPPPAAPPPHQAPSPQAAPSHAAPQIPAQAPPGPAPMVHQESRQSLDVLSKAQTRRSVDVPRPSGEQHNDYIAHEVDLGRESNWWTQRRSPPPVFQNRGDVSIEYDESTTVQNDGRPLVAKHVYVLFMDYSQTIATAYFAPDNPSQVELQQRHEPPPARLRQDQLEAAHTRFGARLAAAAKAKENQAVADGSALALVQELVRTVVPEALAPVGSRAFGAAVYANMANASVQQHDEIRAGDVLSFRNARLQGHRGGLKQKYALELAAHVAFVLDWDGTKQKVRVYEQNGKKVKLESYKLGDLKTGEAKIWRVVSREWVGWGSPT